MLPLFSCTGSGCLLTDVMYSFARPRLGTYTSSRIDNVDVQVVATGSNFVMAFQILPKHEP